MQLDSSRTVTALLVAICLIGAASCKPAGIESARSKWIGSMLDAQYEMSTILLKLETDRDALAHGAPSIDCNPASLKAPYQRAAVSLRELARQGKAIGLAGDFASQIEQVSNELVAVERRHQKLWEETSGLPGATAADRCLRPTELVLSRLTIERLMNSAIKSAL